MRLRSLPAFLLSVVLLSVWAFSDNNPKQAPMSKETKRDLIRAFTAELVYAHTTFPIGKKGLTLKDGEITPSGQDLEKLLAVWGPAVRPGDQMMITAIKIKDNRIHFDINGGSIRKKKWYQHIQIGVNNNNTMETPEDPRVNPRGSSVDLVFDKYIPDIGPQELKDILRPVFNFDAKSRTEAYLQTVPPKVKEAIESHDVLVGMNREMVTYSLGRPPRKLREKDKDDVEYEEWIYGEPPKDVHFVRFVGDEVVRVEVMKIDGEKIVRTEKEVDLGNGPTLATTTKQEPELRPASVPTLRRPGETGPDQGTDGRIRTRRPPADPGSTIPGQTIPPTPPNFTLGR